VDYIYISCSGRKYKDVVKEIAHKYTKIQKRIAIIYKENRDELACCQSVSSSCFSCGARQYIQGNDQDPVNVVYKIRGTEREYDRASIS
jgi:hypothetical protein